MIIIMIIIINGDNQRSLMLQKANTCLRDSTHGTIGSDSLAFRIQSEIKWTRKRSHLTLFKKNWLLICCPLANDRSPSSRLDGGARELHPDQPRSIALIVDYNNQKMNDAEFLQLIKTLWAEVLHTFESTFRFTIDLESSNEIIQNVWNKNCKFDITDELKALSLWWSESDQDAEPANRFPLRYVALRSSASNQRHFKTT